MSDKLIVTSILPAEDAEWLKKHVPLFECPDEVLQQTYYFRWSMYRKHIKRTEVGYVVTEFLPEVPWAGAYNTISCPAGHHFYEGRWIKDPVYLNDYAFFWFRKGGEPRKYSFWAADALYAHALVTGDFNVVRELLPDLIWNYKAWEEERKDVSGLFWQYDDRDGMEFSIGGSGLRPTINSYMYADAMAISNIAWLAGARDVAEIYLQKAIELKDKVERELWDPQAKFFKVRVNKEGLAYTRKLSADWLRLFPENSFQENKLVDVCELQGYIPWSFGLPGEEFGDAWSRLMDPRHFYTPFGPTTAEHSHPMFMAEIAHECLWNGPSWPFATTQALTAMARLLREYNQQHVGGKDYYDLLRIYANSHRRIDENGKVIPWIDENLDPFTGEWIARAKLYARGDANKDRGANYNHSTFCDLIIAGLIGFKPRSDDVLDLYPLIPDEAGWDYFCLQDVAYHGRNVTIVYDKHGTRYGKGKGYRIEVDGKEIMHAESTQPAVIRL